MRQWQRAENHKSYAKPYSQNSNASLSADIYYHTNELYFLSQKRESRAPGTVLWVNNFNAIGVRQQLYTPLDDWT